jgi:chemotaxis protein MotA
MDIATLIGLVGALAMILGAVMMGGNLSAFINVPSVIIVLGGTLMCTLTMQRMHVVVGAIKVAINAFVYHLEPPEELIERIVTLAVKARKDGMLALEREQIDYPFLNKGIQMAIDGSTPDTIRAVLATEMASLRQRHERGHAIFKFMEGTAPAMGLIGTLVGLVQMLRTMNDPATIGPAMAVALLTTFYGAVLAFVVCGPIAKKLESRTDEETTLMRITLSGVMAMVSGENPRSIREQLLSFLAPDLRPAMDEAE